MMVIQLHFLIILHDLIFVSNLIPIIVLAEQNIEHVFMLIILFKTDIIIVIEESIGLQDAAH